jgi:hypothetical protein
MFACVINDCQDDNAAARQVARVSHLFKTTPAFVGVHAYKELEAAGNLIDILDAGEAGEGVVLVNVAPRHGGAKKWPNGTPFGYFNVGGVLVVASLDGLTLSLVKKLQLTDAVWHIDIPETTALMLKEGLLTEKLREQIITTQFRSFDYLPRVARYLWDADEKIGEQMLIGTFDDAPAAVWWVDNFGNCKTTLLERDLNGKDAIETQYGTFKLYRQLRDVPDGEAALVVGSSGFGADRFLELVVQGDWASEKLGLAAGDLLNPPA